MYPRASRAPPFLTRVAEKSQQVTAGQCHERPGSEIKAIKLSWLARWTAFNLNSAWTSYSNDIDFDSLSPTNHPFFLLCLPGPVHVLSSTQSPAKYLLPEVSITDYGKNCVVIDLDETLVHSSFKVHHTLFTSLCLKQSH